jgi:hypothetical protein
MIVYMITTNNGDGSSSIQFLEDPSVVDLLEEHDPETYGGNEGGWYELEVEHCPYHVMTREEALQHLRDYHGYEG